MSRCTDPVRRRQWLWFIALWCGGLLAVLVLSGLVKLLMPV